MNFFVKTAKNETGFFVQVVPNAAHNRVLGFSSYQNHITLKIAIAAPPVDDKANKALVGYMAEYLDIPRSKISLIKGHTSRLKLLSTSISESILGEKLSSKGWIVI